MGADHFCNSCTENRIDPPGCDCPAGSIDKSD